MSRPYIKENSASYASPTFSVKFAFHKLRGGGTISIAGLSNSVSFSITHSNSLIYGDGTDYRAYDVTVGSLGTSSTTTYSPATLTIAYGGTVSTTTNVKYQLNGIQLSSYTASTTAPTLSNFLSGLVSSFVFTDGSTASAGTNSITFTAPKYTGNAYNGITVSGPIVIGASSFTYSNGATFSGGYNIYNMSLSYPNLGATNNFTFIN